MKKAFLMISLLSIIFCSCSKKSKEFEPEKSFYISAKNEEYEIKGDSVTNFETTRMSWNSIKKMNGENYSFTTKIQTSFGLGTSTQITVKNDSVSSRSYDEYELWDGALVPGSTISYYENDKTIGSHERGYPALTMDQIYDNCATMLDTVDRKNNYIYLRSTKEGILTDCGYTPVNCMDGCYTGININSFKWLNK